MSEIIESPAANVISNPADRKKLRGMLEEVVVILGAIEDRKIQKKILIDEIKRQFGITAGQASALASTIHRENFAEKQAASNEFEALYETVMLTAQAIREIEEAKPKFTSADVDNAVMAFNPDDAE